MRLVMNCCLAAALLSGCQEPAPADQQTATPAPARAASAAAALPASHSHAMASVEARFGKPRVPVHTVGILLYDGYTTLDAMGPYQVFSELMGVKTFFVAPHKGLIKNMNGVGVQVDTSIADVRHLDVLVVPGGFGATYRLARDTAVTHWISRIDRTSTYTASVCTGAWVLGGAGLLKGRPATTHWWGRPVLETEFGAHYQPKRWVRSDKYWTSAGVSAGIDMSLAMMREIAGDGYTRAAMLDLEYAPEPPLHGGTPPTTDTATVAWLRRMYDAGLADVKAAQGATPSSAPTK